MDFRDLISSNMSSTNSRYSIINPSGPEQLQIMNMLASALGLRIDGDSNIIRYDSRYDNPYMSEDEFKESESFIENIDLIKYHYVDLTKNLNEPDEKYLKLINHLWYNNDAGDFPTIEEIVEELFDTRCDCSYSFDNTRCKELLKHFFILGVIPGCNTLRTAMELYILHNTLPTLDDIEKTLERMRSFYNNPEDFHQEDKVLIGVKNLDQVNYHVMDKNEFKSDDDLACSICQDDITDGQKYIKLDCRHMFHYSKEECLEGGSILDWLKRNKHCPNCKTEVKIEK